MTVSHHPRNLKRVSSWSSDCQRLTVEWSSLSSVSSNYFWTTRFKASRRWLARTWHWLWLRTCWDVIQTLWLSCLTTLSKTHLSLRGRERFANSPADTNRYSLTTCCKISSATNSIMITSQLMVLELYLLRLQLNLVPLNRAIVDLHSDFESFERSCTRTSPTLTFWNRDLESYIINTNHTFVQLVSVVVVFL
jgi:hypothetical protein